MGGRAAVGIYFLRIPAPWGASRGRNRSGTGTVPYLQVTSAGTVPDPQFHLGPPDSAGGPVAAESRRAEVSCWPLEHMRATTIGAHASRGCAVTRGSSSLDHRGAVECQSGSGSLWACR